MPFVTRILSTIILSLIAQIAFAQTHETMLKRNAVDALWLLPYDIPRQQYSSIMPTYGSSLKQVQNDLVDEVNIDGLPANPLSEMFPVETGRELETICSVSPLDIEQCIVQVRQNLSKSRHLLQTHQKLLQRIDALADYDILYDYDFANNSKLHMLNIYFPRYELLVKPPLIATIMQWQLGQAETAMRYACRQVKTGKLLINSNMALVSAMLGDVIINHHLQLIAHIDASTPNLPHIAECDAALTPLPNEMLTMCHVFQVEQALQQRAIAMQEAHDVARFQHSQTQAEAVNQFVCTAPFAQAIQADQKAELPNIARDEDSAYLAEQYPIYFYRIQDTNLKIRAVQAAWQLNRLTPRRAQDVERILQQHSTPSRRLRLQDNSIVFDAYTEKRRDTSIPLRPIAH